jgi:hypothetical protein
MSPNKLIHHIFNKSHLSQIATGYVLDSWGFTPGKGRIFLFFTPSKPALGPTQPPIQCVPVALSPGVKWQGHEADYSPPSSAEVKYDRAILPLLRTSSWHCAQLINHSDNFTFLFNKFVWTASIISHQMRCQYYLQRPRKDKRANTFPLLCLVGRTMGSINQANLCTSWESNSIRTEYKLSKLVLN